MLTVIFGDELDWRFAILIKTMIIFNAIPVILLLLCFIISSIAIYSSALLIQLISFLFGLAIFAPIMLFSSLIALIISFIIITSRQFFVKQNVQSFPTFVSYQRRLKME
ncbi:putative integral membrane protein [Acanthocheilonema viteae]